MPFGVEVFGRALANRLQRGLYANREVLFGNKLSKGKDGPNKSRRKWLPNAQYKKLWSDTLNRMLSLRVTTGAMRSIDKAGGLDRYLFKIRGTREDSVKAGQIREQLELKARKARKRLKTLQKPLVPKTAADNAQLKAASTSTSSTNANLEKSRLDIDSKLNNSSEKL